MAKRVVLDEFLLTVRVPADLPDAAADAARRVLFGAEFLRRLKRAARVAVRAAPELADCRVTVSR